MLKSTLARMREAHAVEVEGEGVAEAGFTLIELMVVLLIIAILLAIAIPTFLGVTSSARDRAVQSNVTNAMTELQAQYQNNQSYSFIGTDGAGQATLNSSAPEFTWASGAASTDQNHMSVTQLDVASTGDAQGVVVASLNKTTGKCWYAMNLQANPVSGIGLFTTGTTLPSRAGTFYAYQQTSSTVTCAASNVAANWTFGNSYSTAPSA